MNPRKFGGGIWGAYPKEKESKVGDHFVEVEVTIKTSVLMDCDCDEEAKERVRDIFKENHNISLLDSEIRIKR